MNLQLVTKQINHSLESIESENKVIDNPSKLYNLHYRVIQNIDKVIENIIKLNLLSTDTRSIIGATNADFGIGSDNQKKYILLIFKQKLNPDDIIQNRGIVIEYDDFKQESGAYLAYFNLKHFIDNVFDESKIAYEQYYLPKITDNKELIKEVMYKTVKDNLHRKFYEQLVGVLKKSKHPNQTIELKACSDKFNVNTLIDLQSLDNTDETLYIYLEDKSETTTYDI
jgi:hypothetical protein